LETAATLTDGLSLVKLFLKFSDELTTSYRTFLDGVADTLACESSRLRRGSSLDSVLNRYRERRGCGCSMLDIGNNGKL
jgi:hypothetical protein